MHHLGGWIQMGDRIEPRHINKETRTIGTIKDPSGQDTMVRQKREKTGDGFQKTNM